MLDPNSRLAQVPLACPVVPVRPGCVSSLTVYSFDLDARTAFFQDFDVLTPARRMTLPRQFAIKRVNPQIRNVSRASIHYFGRVPASVEQALRSPNERLANAQVKLNGVAFEVDFGRPQVVVPGTALLLQLAYEIDLAGPGLGLLYAGSVQPSDYRGLGEAIGSLEVHKHVVLHVSSSAPFRASVFDGSQTVPFPSEREALQDRISGAYVVRETIHVNMDDMLRAQIFSLSARPLGTARS